jgi:hypothetical protein
MACSVVAQEWRKVNLAGDAPPVRELHRMAFNLATKNVVMHGGWTGYGGELGDTWEWNGQSWKRKRFVAGDGGPVRLSHVMAYDSLRERVVLFSGQPASGLMEADTWEYGGLSWKTITTATAPTRRYGGAMAYDGKRQVIVMFGGFSGSQSLGDTWVYNGNDWKEMTPLDSPDRRQDHCMVYDMERQMVVMFGGYYYTGDAWKLDPNTWVWDGQNWKKLAIPGPPGRTRHAMAYDRYRAKVILFGGEGVSGKLNDIWEFDGDEWVQIGATGPTARYRTFMVYDRKRKKTIMFGGHDSTGYLNDTWEYGCYFDIKVKPKKFTQESVLPGGRLALVAVVKNRGPEQSKYTSVRYYLSKDKIWDKNDVLLDGSVQITPLQRKQKKKYTYSAGIPTTVSWGYYYVIARSTAEDMNVFNSSKAYRKLLLVSR